MKFIGPTRWKYLCPLLLILPLAALGYVTSVVPQTRERTVGPTKAEADVKVADTIKTDVDLITVDALVMQKSTARVVGNLKLETLRFQKTATNS